MDSGHPPPTLARTVTKLLRLRRATADPSPAAKLKPSRGSEATAPAEPFKPPNDKPAAAVAAMDALLADLFATVSAIKSAYAQLQVAQSPYDPAAIHSADRSLVSDLKRLSDLKRSYLNNLPPPDPRPALAAHIHEQRHLLKTFQITVEKLESELRTKDSELASLKSKLLDLQNHNKSLDVKLHPGRSLYSLHNLHHSGLNPTHFLTAVRYAVKSVRSFAKLLSKSMESAGWDLAAAAEAIEPLPVRPEHRRFVFESFVSRRMFAGFHSRDFGLRRLSRRREWGPRRFFEEFGEAKEAGGERFSDPEAHSGKFCRAKYSELVHPRMEAALGLSEPSSELGSGFVEVARRVWILHCLFFSYGSDSGGGEGGSIFRARRGYRFSEVYMESVADDVEEVGPGGGDLAVGFTVVPGFRIGRTVVQCKVFLSSGGRS